jgi:hypothetical protein
MRRRRGTSAVLLLEWTVAGTCEWSMLPSYARRLLGGGGQPIHTPR